MVKRITSLLLTVLAIILLVGIATQRSNPFGTEHQLIVLGAALMLIHAAANPNMLIKPTKYKIDGVCRLRLARTLGLVFCVLGLAELSGVFDHPTVLIGV